MKHLRILVLLVGLFVLVACGGDDPTPEPTATPQPTFTATALATPTEVATAVPTPVPAAPAAVAPDSPLTATAPVTASEVTTTTTAASSEPCAKPLNIDLSGYPDMAHLSAVLGCPQADASLDPVAINEFGNGPDYDRFMLWFGTEKQIYVLFANQTWLAYSDTWSEGEAEISCNPTNGVTKSPPLPRRGFGKLWCTVADVQKEMGLIDREERLCQHSVTQRFDKGRLLACFEDATIRYFRVLDDGRWDMLSVK